MKSPWNFSKFELLMNFQLYKAANFYKIPQEIWLTLSRFTGRQEKKDALAGTSTNPSAICQISSASMLAALA